MTKRNPDPQYCSECGKKLRKDSKMPICYSCYRLTEEYKQENAAIARACYQRRRLKEYTLDLVEKVRK
jgi:hypothetical protein